MKEIWCQKTFCNGETTRKLKKKNIFRDTSDFTRQQEVLKKITLYYYGERHTSQEELGRQGTRSFVTYCIARARQRHKK